MDSNYMYDYIDGLYETGSEGENRFYYYGDLSQLRKPWLTETDYIPTVIIYGLAFLVGIVGNSLVIFAIVSDIKQRTNTTMFLLSLASSDILFLLVCVPYEISRHFIDHWKLGAFLCKLSGFIEMLTAVLTVLNLTIISIERYIAIVHPMRSRYICTLGNLRRIIPLVWATAALLSSPAFFIMSTEMSVFYNNQSSVNKIFCSDHGVADAFRLSFAGYQFVIMFLVPLIIMMICYSRVVHVLWISTKELAKLTPSDRVCDALFLTRIETCSLGMKTPAVPRLLKRAITSHKSKVLASRKQVIKLLLMIIVAFLLSWGPKLTMRILQKLQLSFLFSKSAYAIKVFIDWLPYIQSCINPLFYCFMSRNFRRSIRVMFQRKFRREYTTSNEHNDFQTLTSSSSGRHLHPAYMHMVFRDDL
ncbi:galanin receptor type 1-like [Ruditapes philippinarum]|uniref:galanin receptor type 1-like n=1 Tax=Ruditapes philippinarum TaxID=129788 RepID=UPI00295AE1B5|nr:galanin receptor type 1-like [Ruditapes philippinarum]